MGRLAGDLADVEGRVLDALIELQGEQPFESIPIATLCKRAGVSRQTFYRHYKSTEDVYLAYLDELLNEVFVNDASMSFDELFESMGKLFAGNRRFLACLFQANLDARILLRYERLLIAMGARGDLGPSAEYTQAFIAGGVFNVMKRWAIKGAATDGKRFAALLREVSTPTVESARRRASQ